MGKHKTVVQALIETEENGMANNEAGKPADVNSSKGLEAAGWQVYLLLIYSLLKSIPDQTVYIAEQRKMRSFWRLLLGKFKLHFLVELYIKMLPGL